ncbi:MAG: J domain-containing protein [Rhizomicrobium sp.]
MRHADNAYGGSRAVQKNAVAVEITRTDGKTLHARLFLPIQGRISDLLNDDRSFIPLECDGEYLALAKASILQVCMPSAQAPQRKNCPYSVLGLQEGASIEEVKKAYYEVCRTSHPDRIRGAGLGHDFIEFANQNMMRINAAYAQLTKGTSQQAA